MALLDQFGREAPGRPRLCGFVPPPSQVIPPKPQTCYPADAIANTTIQPDEDY